MLSIGKLGAAQASYYTDQLTHSIGEDQPVRTQGSSSDQVDYYAAHESPSRWMGASLQRLGIKTGESIDKTAFTRLMNHETPEGAAMTLANAHRLKVAALDYTLSAPKSVSLLFAYADPATRETVIAAHHRAVEAAFDYMQQKASQTRIVERIRDDDGNHKTRTRTTETDGYIAAAFDHFTSRANDPQVHTHVVVINRVWAEDGWRAIDAKRAYAHAKAAGTIYQAVLRDHLTQALGVSWKPITNGMADIAGISEELIRHFSTRRTEILQAVDRYLAQHGGEAHRRMMQTFTLETRQPKAHPKGAAKVTAEMKDYGITTTIESHWQHLAETAPHDVVSAVHQVIRTGRDGTRPTETELVDAAAAITQELTDRQPVFTERDLVAFVAAHYPEGATAAELTSATSTLLSHATDNRTVLTILPTSSEELTLPPGVQLTAEEVDLVTAGQPSWIKTGHHIRFRALPGEPRYTTQLQLDREQSILDAVNTDSPIPVDSTQLENAITERSLTDIQATAIRRLAALDGQIVSVVGPGGSGKTHSIGAYTDTLASNGRQMIGVATSAAAARNLATAIPDAWTGTIAMLRTNLEHTRHPLPTGTVIVADEASMISTKDLAWLIEQIQAVDGKLILIGDPKQLPSIDSGAMFHRIVETGHNVVTDLADVNQRQTLQFDRDVLQRLRAGQVRAAIYDYENEGRLHLGRDEYQTKAAMVDAWWQDTKQHGVVGARMLASRHDDVWMLNQLARTNMEMTGQITGPILTNRWGMDFQAGDRVVVRDNWYRHSDLRNGQTGTITSVDLQNRALSFTRDIDGVEITLPKRYVDANLDHAYAQTIHTAQGQTFQTAHLYTDAGIHAEHGYTALSRARQETHLWINHEDGPLGECTHIHGTPLEHDPIETVIRQLTRTMIEPPAIDHGITLHQATDQQLQEWRADLLAVINASPLLARIDEELVAVEAAIEQANEMADIARTSGTGAQIERLTQQREQLAAAQHDRMEWSRTNCAVLVDYSAISKELQHRHITAASSMAAQSPARRAHASPSLQSLPR